MSPDLAPPQPLIDRLGRQRGLLLGSLLILVIALLDFKTGYAFRLGELYLVPTAIVAWSAGMLAGIIAAICASLFWFISFESGNFYLNPGFYIWEAVAMFGGLCAFAWMTARLRKALTHADERFVRAIEKIPSAIYVSDDQRDEMLYANERLLYLAESGTSITPGNFEQHFTHEPEAAYRPTDAGTPPAFFSGVVRDGRSGRWYLLQDSRIPWGNAPDVHLKVLTDITDRKQAEILREKHAEALSRAARMSSLAEIATSLAHEVNQPLMVITTYMDASLRLIDAGKTDMKELSGIMRKCQQQAVRAASIIQRVRDFIRQRNLQPTRCEARSLIMEVIDLLKVSIEEAGIQVDLQRIDADAVFPGDRILLIQLFDNLIRNAIEAMQATPPARRQLQFSARRLDPDTVELAIADSGHGLDERAFEHLFSPFFTTKDSGLGLGLAICRSIAESHDGQLRAENNASGGATFILTLPAIQAP